MQPIPVINRPDLKNGARTLGELGFTGFMWAVWSYIFLPVFNLLFWVLGVRHVYVVVFSDATYTALLNLLGGVGWTVLAVFLVLRGWGLYNYWRYAKLTRRKHTSPVQLDSLAEFVQLTPHDLRMLQDRKEVNIGVAFQDLRSGTADGVIPLVATQREAAGLVAGNA